MPKKHRGIDVDFWTDEKVVQLTPLARLLFIGMWHYCCDRGHLDATPLELKMRVLPADGCDINALFGELVGGGLVTEVDGGYDVPKLPEHQRIDKRWLLSCERCQDTSITGGAREDHARTTSGARGDHAMKGDERKGKEDKPSSENESPTRPEIERLCTRLADRIESNGSKRPTITKKWRDAARLMLDKDGRTEEQISRCIDWCQSDEFWRGNVLSMPKLRDQYDRLRLAAQRSKGTPEASADPEWSEQVRNLSTFDDSNLYEETA